MKYQEVYRAVNGMRKEAELNKEALMSIGKLNKQFILPFLKSTAGMKNKLGVRFSDLANIGYNIPQNILKNKGISRQTQTAMQKQLKDLTELLQTSGAKKRLTKLIGNPKYRPLERLFNRTSVGFKGENYYGYGQLYNKLLEGAKIKRDVAKTSLIPASLQDSLNSISRTHFSNINRRAEAAARKALRQAGPDRNAPGILERFLDLFR